MCFTVGRTQPSSIASRFEDTSPGDGRSPIKTGRTPPGTASAASGCPRGVRRRFSWVRYAVSPSSRVLSQSVRQRSPFRERPPAAIPPLRDARVAPATRGACAPPSSSSAASWATTPTTPPTSSTSLASATAWPRAIKPDRRMANTTMETPQSLAQRNTVVHPSQCPCGLFQ